MAASIAFVSLGCDKNLVDSEVMIGILGKEGFNIISDESQADIIVVNTCCFIKDALEESIETIIEVARYKEEGKCKGIIVAGCLGQRYSEEMFEEMPEVDAVVGTASFEKIAEAARAVLEGKKTKILESIDKPMDDENGKLRVLSTAGHFAYLKISEGCDNHCTYCIIPKLRGKYRSRTISSLVEEAVMLAEQGVKELILVAQDTALYGKDLYGEPKLDKLIKCLAAVDGIEWIRILYCYPEHITDELVKTIAEEDKVVKYIDMPIQHISDTVLRRMGRKNTSDIIVKRIDDLREAVPEIAIRTTVITGFPGETEEEFEELCRFVEETGFDKLGAFAYSAEEGTPAAIMDGQIDEEVKEKRRDIIMEMQKDISGAVCEDMIGRAVRVLIEGRLAEDGTYVGRCYKDAPNVDGMVFARSDEELLTGDFCDVLITGAGDYDLMGEVVNADESC
ncbi:MAG: 30S ribosomal protein S12 methylthiotransferase RimO [Firmicutes bacterium]|nr:30S ribosomal protein S12 methylthiotransferase RimO [Bacillota bacterium]